MITLDRRVSIIEGTSTVDFCFSFWIPSLKPQSEGVNDVTLFPSAISCLLVTDQHQMKMTVYTNWDHRLFCPNRVVDRNGYFTRLGNDFPIVSIFTVFSNGKINRARSNQSLSGCYHHLYFDDQLMSLKRLTKVICQQQIHFTRTWPGKRGMMNDLLMEFHKMNALFAFNYQNWG